MLKNHVYPEVLSRMAWQEVTTSYHARVIPLSMCVAISAAQVLINNGSYIISCLPNCAIPQARAITSAPIMNNDVELYVYPNPTAGNVHIEYRSETDNAQLILITDLQGRTVKTLDIKGAFEFHGKY